MSSLAMVLTPRFTVSQDNDFIIVNLKVPYLKVWTGNLFLIALISTYKYSVDINLRFWNGWKWIQILRASILFKVPFLLFSFFDVPENSD